MVEGAPPRDARLIQESKIESTDAPPKQLSCSRSRCEGYIGRDIDAFSFEQPAKANNGDYLHAAHCASCDALVGSHVLPADGNTSESTTVRLLKYATYPASSDPARPAPPRHTLSTYLTADMLETGQAHACHRFILEDAQTEQAKLLVRSNSLLACIVADRVRRWQLWFFNPSIRLSFSSSTADANSLLSPSDTPAAPSLTFRSMNSVKVFYAVVENDNAAVWCASRPSSLPNEANLLPLPLSARHSSRPSTNASHTPSPSSSASRACCRPAPSSTHSRSASLANSTLASSSVSRLRHSIFLSVSRRLCRRLCMCPYFAVNRIASQSLQHMKYRAWVES